jgi:hypothetical protein
VEAFTADGLDRYWPRVTSTTQQPNNEEHKQERYADICQNNDKGRCARTKYRFLWCCTWLAYIRTRILIALLYHTHGSKITAEQLGNLATQSPNLVHNCKCNWIDNITQAKTRTYTEVEFVQRREEEDIRQRLAPILDLGPIRTNNLPNLC